MELVEKYEYNIERSLPRPDIKPPLGWSISLITGVNRIYNHRLSPDGKWIAFIWNRDELADVYKMPSTGGWPVRLTTNRASSPWWWEEVPQWSPDSQWLTFCIDHHVHVAPAGGGEPVKITDFATKSSSPIWMPDCTRIIFSIERHESTKLFMTDREGNYLRLLTTGDGNDFEARPSPDGRNILFNHQPHDDLNRWELHLLDLESDQVRALTGQPGVKDWGARWSADGKQIAFISQRSGNNEIWLVNPDGGGLRQLTSLKKDFADLAWSPDGISIACNVNHDGAFHLALVELSTGEVKYLRHTNGIHTKPNWSPKGDSLTVEYEDPFLPPDIYRVSLPEEKVTQLTFSNLPALENLKLVMPEVIRYKSYDGLEIPALFYKPAKPNKAAIVYPHGGPRDQEVFSWDIMTQYLVAKGYTILSPNYRGSTGFGLEFERGNQDDWGVGDTQDCLHGARYLAELEWVDPQRIGIYGASYGGYMVTSCLSNDPDYLFACGVCLFGDANLLTSWAQCELGTRLYTEMQIGNPSRQRQIYKVGSPIYNVENVRKPVLVLHGLDDDVVPPQSSEEWIAALRRAGKAFEYKTYAGEPHGFQARKNVIDLFERIEQFFDWYLLPENV